MPMNKNFPNECKILFATLFLLLLMSFLGQYSAFGGQLEGSTLQHAGRIVIGLVVMCGVYTVNFRFWNNFAYLFYAFIFASLIAVDLAGTVKLGAKRWVDLYFFTFQPSEPMKLALILALARYYSPLSQFEVEQLRSHTLPVLFTILPVVLVLRQPDLGTAVLLAAAGCCMIFLSGFPLKTFVAIIASFVVLCPFGWFFLHDYQKNRILTFIDPDRDQLGMGYHILQSKIAIGSGRLWGRGFLQGTQSKLDFLPEKNTDFIFTTISEEFGFAGAVLILLLFLALCSYFFWVASESRTKFSKLTCYGLGISLFLHVFVNISMVMGVLPVVGVPLPFLSYGGSSMISFMISCGLVIAASGQKRVVST
ncbi:MAG: rod shape-determining protein RodA [Holosporaceae bacterium]|jgi:rod shape determining protein RodA|nr:rod shape-determining protein RodA [Holosporaceae bacterium]